MTIKIDGSYGEGGGQILRTALALSCVLQKEIEIYNIRKRRKIPGLQAQHLTCVKAAKAISEAEVEGDSLKSQVLRFSPKKIRGGNLFFDVGTAGSVCLVLQSILLPLSFALVSSELRLRGGTHVPFSPPATYFQRVLFPMLSKLGLSLSLGIGKWGWYPKGGGEVICNIRPVEKIKPLNLMERGKLLSLSGLSVVSNLPLSIARRQEQETEKMLGENNFDLKIEVLEAPSIGKGTFFFLLASYENSLAGFSSLGEIGKKAEQVSDEACKGFLDYMKTSGAVEEHLADQLIPFLAFAQGESNFSVSRVSQHLLTSIWVTQRFFPVKIEVEGRENEPGKIQIIP
ncbi:MAG: RNA 3'-terminal phosphate cyclase [candidate division Zixibacteria bacterium]|nr:RNA 3'-terminal phosphate cyclase [candidate division Zixibacteria bacterium]